MKTKLELLGLGNLMGNIYKVISWKISKEKYPSKYVLFINEHGIATFKIRFTTLQTMEIIGASLPN